MGTQRAKKRAFRLLFICTANQCRSKAFEEEIGRHFAHVECKSAGTDGGTAITEGLLAWADCIPVMELRHYEYLESNFPEFMEKVEILGIKDRFYAGHPKLRELALDWGRKKGLARRNEISER